MYYYTRRRDCHMRVCIKYIYGIKRYGKNIRLKKKSAAVAVVRIYIRRVYTEERMCFDKH
jgi:hypothetical protein